jgi:hypothetical protein
MANNNQCMCNTVPRRIRNKINLASVKSSLKSAGKIDTTGTRNEMSEGKQIKKVPRRFLRICRKRYVRVS